MIVQCCVCKKVRKDGHWVELRTPLRKGAFVSHGYCPVCAAKAFEEVRRVVADSAKEPDSKKKTRVYSAA
ncbi:MAG: hypothetical protein JXR94_00495 [Candidatus Hydrogenedentes bacterium]|nr:hypothetical protein [Candidatus Hydrogenedentota bacterium]